MIRQYQNGQALDPRDDRRHAQPAPGPDHAAVCGVALEARLTIGTFDVHDGTACAVCRSIVLDELMPSVRR